MGVLRIWKESYMRSGPTYFVVAGAMHMEGRTGSYLCFGNVVTAFSKLDRPPGTLWCGNLCDFFLS